MVKYHPYGHCLKEKQPFSEADTKKTLIFGGISALGERRVQYWFMENLGHWNTKDIETCVLGNRDFLPLWQNRPNQRKTSGENNNIKRIHFGVGIERKHSIFQVR